jgi:calcium permeable stress-gated cation channel
LSITFFFALIVIYPINRNFLNSDGFGSYPRGNGTHPNGTFGYAHILEDDEMQHPKLPEGFPWMYVAFIYLFSGLAIYLLVKETRKIIYVRQGYLGSQSTVTDRTLRLSGIPSELRSEDKIKTFIEDLQIGKVDSVMLCRNWKKLDKLMEERMACLRRLEEAWTVHLGHRRIERNSGTLPVVQPPPPGPAANGNYDEQAGLLSGSEFEHAHVAPYKRDRPQIRIRYGRFKMQSKKIDAIDYYEEELRKLDDTIAEARKKEYPATPLAFVTMESTAACQMAVQASLDPNPGQFLTSLAPAPTDVVWENTYLSRYSRMLRSWTIMAIVGVLTIFWIFIIVPFAGLLEIESIRSYLPGLAKVLEAHKVLKTLVSTSLPTLVLSLLSILVPYLYDWLSNMQGMTSQGDVELSLISKNFLFTFFNLFIVFTVFGTAATFTKFQDNLRDIFKDTSTLAYTIANSLEGLTLFYVDLIILQGIGLFPFRLLEFGAVAMYPVWLIGAKTPRDYAELVQPPVFNYGYFVPQTILVFIICTVYSVLDGSWLVLLSGLLFFLIGKFVYKYQLLYAMDHRQHSTGRAWPMICNRVFVGLAVFQIAMSGWLALRKAFICAVVIAPLLIGTIWFNVYFQRTFDPLMRFIALRSIGRDNLLNLPTPPEPRWAQETDWGRTIDTDPETGLRYVNPSLVAPLEKLWIKDVPVDGETS